MQFGVCADISQAAALAAAGYDFIEGNVCRDLINHEDEAAFEAFCEQIKQAPIPMMVANCFLPGKLKIVGPNVDMNVLHEYVAKAMCRAARAGLETIIFGCGDARKIPDGFDEEEAWRQIVAFTHVAVGEARTHGVTLVIEPLRSSDCNFINTVTEGAALVREVNHPNLRLLVDSYHWGCENDSAAEIVENAKLLHHVHVATPDRRLPPGGGAYDWSPFYSALKKGGYDGRLSIEANWDDLPAQAGAALDAMRSHVADAGLAQK